MNLKTKVGDYFYVVTKECPSAGPHSSGYVSVAYREYTEGPHMGLADWRGWVIPKGADIEAKHLEYCALVKSYLKEGGKWHGSDRPLVEEYPTMYKKSKLLGKIQ